MIKFQRYFLVEKTSCISEMKNTLKKQEEHMEEYEKTIQNVCIK